MWYIHYDIIAIVYNIRTMVYNGLFHKYTTLNLGHWKFAVLIDKHPLTSPQVVHVYKWNRPINHGLYSTCIYMHSYGLHVPVSIILDIGRSFSEACLNSTAVCTNFVESCLQTSSVTMSRIIQGSPQNS